MNRPIIMYKGKNISVGTKYKYPFLVAIRHFKHGLYYKFPLCCIIQFSLEISQLIAPASKRNIDFDCSETSDEGFVPCNKCLKGKEL